MKKQRGSYEGMFALLMLLMVMIVVALASYFTCEARWSKSGFAISWGPVQGCLVDVGGRWIPDDRVREIDLQSK